MKLTPFYNNIKSINKAYSSKNDNYVRIDFQTKDGKELSIAVEFMPFCKWLKKKRDKSKEIFKDFIDYFVKSSKEVGQDINLSEIVDSHGNIMPSNEMPNNANHRMIGPGVSLDMTKIYRQSIPRHNRFYSGDLGIGIITW